MFKKSSKKSLRARKTSDDDNNAQESATEKHQIIDIKTLKAEKKKKNKPKPAAEVVKQSVLSFGGDEEEEEPAFQLKKSSRSRRIAKHIKRIAQEEKERNENDGNKYTKETLEELRALSVQPPVFEAQVDDAKEQSTMDFPLQPSNYGISELRPGEIPDANRIHAARKQREMMRKYGSEYIPVENASNTNALRERQDQNDNSSDDDGPMVEMKGIISNSARVAQEIGSEGESALKRDNEFDEWEAEMIKKGTGTQQFLSRNDAAGFESYNDVMRVSQSSNYNGNSHNMISSNRMSSSQLTLSSEEAVGKVKSRIRAQLENVQQTHSTRKRDYERTNLDILTSEESAGKMSDVSSLSNQYTYFQDIKAYVADLLDCLGEKNTEISLLEDSQYSIWKEQAALKMSRRQQDVRDESDDINISLSNNKIVSNAVDHQKQTRTREREARRTRRRANRQIARTQHIDGLSTDDEVTSMDKAKWDSKHSAICKSIDGIFSDVVEEFCDVHVVLSRFHDWKKQYPDSYNDAYIGLCLPKLILPFVRLQMIGWNPLQTGVSSIEDMHWYKNLLFHGSDSNSEDFETDSDNKLLSGLFDKLMMPKLIFFAGEVWDPLSKSQSLRLSTLLHKYSQTYPCFRAESKRCSELLVTICERIKQTIDSDAFIPIYPTSALSNITSGPGAFFERQTWTCIKLFQNIILFSKVLSRDILIELSFTLLLNRYIMLALQISPANVVLVQKCSSIVSVLPQEWLDDIDDLSTHLEPFTRFLFYVAKLINSEIVKCNPLEKIKARNCIFQLGKLLSKVGSHEVCQEVAEMLGLDMNVFRDFQHWVRELERRELIDLSSLKLWFFLLLLTYGGLSWVWQKIVAQTDPTSHFPPSLLPPEVRRRLPANGFTSEQEARAFAIREMEIAVIACRKDGDKTNSSAIDAVTMMKSAALLSKSIIHFYIYTEDELYPIFMTELDKWPPYIRHKVSFIFSHVTYPESLLGWENLHRPCSSFRLFLPHVLMKLDFAMTLDSDSIFLNSANILWSSLLHFKPSECLSLAATFKRGGALSKYGIKSLDARAIVYDVYRLRHSLFKVPISFDIKSGKFDVKNMTWHPNMLHSLYQLFRSDITVPDQDILSILYHFNQEKFHLMGCEWNYRWDYCQSYLLWMKSLFLNFTLNDWPFVKVEPCKNAFVVHRQVSLLPKEKMNKEFVDLQDFWMVSGFNHPKQEFLNALDTFLSNAMTNETCYRLNMIMFKRSANVCPA